MKTQCRLFLYLCGVINCSVLFLLCSKESLRHLRINCLSSAAAETEKVQIAGSSMQGFLCASETDIVRCCALTVCACAVRPVLPETVNAANCPPLCRAVAPSPRTSFFLPFWSLSHLRFHLHHCKQANKQPDLLAHAGPWIHRWLADCSLQLATARRMIMHDGHK